MFVTEHFLSGIVNKDGQYPVSTADGETLYHQVSHFLKLKYHLHSSFEKSIIKRTIQYIKDRTENFDDYFPCKRKKNKCKLNQVKHLCKISSIF
jgi:putative transposase